MTHDDGDIVDRDNDGDDVVDGQSDDNKGYELSFNAHVQRHQ